MNDRPISFEALVRHLVLDLILLRHFATHDRSVAVLSAISAARGADDTKDALDLLQSWIDRAVLQ